MVTKSGIGDNVTVTLLSAALEASTGDICTGIIGNERTFQAAVTGTGAVSASVAIKASNDPSGAHWITLATISLSGTTSATDGFATVAPWPFIKAELTDISGTGAAVSCWMGV